MFIINGRLSKTVVDLQKGEEAAIEGNEEQSYMI